MAISYTPAALLLEVASLLAYIESYKGGRGEIRSMEGMIQQITQDCADALETTVNVVALLKITPAQEMKLECAAYPKKKP